MKRFAHIWNYYNMKDNPKVHVPTWVCRNCGIVTIRNPFFNPQHIKQLEEKHIQRIALKREKQAAKDRDRFKKGK